MDIEMCTVRNREKEKGKEGIYMWKVEGRWSLWILLYLVPKLLKFHLWIRHVI
jgi:hypothetical protein